MDAHLTFKEHHNRCLKKARAAEARLRTLTKMHGIVPEWVRAIQIACIQAVAQYGSEIWWDPKATSRREDLQLLFSWQARSTLGALPMTPLSAVMRDSGLTPVPVVMDSRQQQYLARLANACEGTKLKEMYHYPIPGATICRIIKKEHDRG